MWAPDPETEGPLAALAGWWIWAYVAYLIGTRLLPGPETRADPGELVRAIGFSSAPGVLRVLGVVSPIAGPVFLVCTIWMLVAMVVAVRQALDYRGSVRAVAVCAIGFPIYGGPSPCPCCCGDRGPWDVRAARPLVQRGLAADVVVGFRVDFPRFALLVPLDRVRDRFLALARVVDGDLRALVERADRGVLGLGERLARLPGSVSARLLGPLAGA